MSSQAIKVKFNGPFSWLGNNDTTDIFTADLGRKSGIYLWTVKYNDGDLITYVGETGRSFSVRLLDHFKEHMSGGYHLYEPEKYMHGTQDELWPGRYDRKRRTTVAEFLRKFRDLSGPIEELARLYRFYIAPLEIDRQLRERIEAGLADHLSKQEGLIQEYLDKGVRYRRHRDEDKVQVFFEPDPKLLGIPAFLWV